MSWSTNCNQKRRLGRKKNRRCIINDILVVAILLVEVSISMKISMVSGTIHNNVNVVVDNPVRISKQSSSSSITNADVVVDSSTKITDRITSARQRSLLSSSSSSFSSTTTTRSNSFPIPPHNDKRSHLKSISSIIPITFVSLLSSSSSSITTKRLSPWGTTKDKDNLSKLADHSISSPFPSTDETEVDTYLQQRHHHHHHHLLGIIAHVPRGGSSSSSDGNGGYYNDNYYNDNRYKDDDDNYNDSYSSNKKYNDYNDYNNNGSDDYYNYGNSRDGNNNDNNNKKDDSYYYYGDDEYDDGIRRTGGRYDDNINDNDRDRTPFTSRVSAMMPNMIKTGNRQIGVPLLGIGMVLTVLGMTLFFNKALMRLGNLFFVAGVPMTLGPGRTAGYFLQQKKARATACLVTGIFLVFVGWPILGLALEIFGLLNLFGNMFPLAYALLKQMPVIGPLLRGDVGGGSGGGFGGGGGRRGRRNDDRYDDYPYDEDGRDRRRRDDDGRDGGAGGGSGDRYDDYYNNDDYGSQRYY